MIEKYYRRIYLVNLLTQKSIFALDREKQSDIIMISN